eukprot:TRINITY_DN26187_c0_g2_i2.p1 TRINITY_DN26187_c0_g2~~TRINITY_DN26187_c0_g2_i2.p1  ORF type:complete len:899 (+),score=184.80 TRINITY_DN26187_c0_g2_i2:155-2851(+)
MPDKADKQPWISRWLAVSMCSELSRMGTSRKSRMRIHEQLFLNPFHKWQRYRVVPVAFITHALLVVLVTLQVMYYLRYDITHASSAAQHFSSLFLGTSQGSRTLLQPEELRSTIEQSVRNIFDINDVTFNDVTYMVNGVHNADALPVRLLFRNGTVKSLNLSRSDFFGGENARSYLKQTIPYVYDTRVQELETLLFDFEIREKVQIPPYDLEYIWNLTTCFDGTQVGRFKGTLTYTMGTNKQTADFHYDYHMALNFLILCLAVCSVGLTLRKVQRSVSVLLEVRKLMLEDVDDWDSGSPSVNLSYADQLALFNLWWVVGLCSSACQIFASLRCLRPTNDVTLRFSMLGWSCFLTWLTICQYFESFPGYYVTFSTVTSGMAKICRYTISVVPILTAFMFLGTCNFWQATTFTGVKASYASLFSLLNGDMVHDTFIELDGIAGWAGQLYVYIFIFIFIYIILNVNISIIEEAFYVARAQGHRHDDYAEMALQRQVSTPGTSAAPSRQRSVMTGNEFGSSQDLAGQDINVGGGRLSGVMSVERMVSGCDGEDEHELFAERPPMQEYLVTTGAISDSEAPVDHLRLSSTSSCMPQLRQQGYLVKGRMSPRFLERPRLQEALAAAYPQEFGGRRGLLGLNLPSSSLGYQPPPILEGPTSFFDSSGRQPLLLPEGAHGGGGGSMFEAGMGATPSRAVSAAGTGGALSSAASTPPALKPSSHSALPPRLPSAPRSGDGGGGGGGSGGGSGGHRPSSAAAPSSNASSPATGAILLAAASGASPSGGSALHSPTADGPSSEDPRPKPLTSPCNDTLSLGSSSSRQPTTVSGSLRGPTCAEDLMQAVPEWTQQLRHAKEVLAQASVSSGSVGTDGLSSDAGLQDLERLLTGHAAMLQEALDSIRRVNG